MSYWATWIVPSRTNRRLGRYVESASNNLVSVHPEFEPIPAEKGNHGRGAWATTVGEFSTAMINPSCSQAPSSVPATSGAFDGSTLAAMAEHIAAKLAPSHAIRSAFCSIESTARKCDDNSLRQTRNAVGASSCAAVGGVFSSDRAVQIVAQFVEIDVIRRVGTMCRIALFQSTPDRASAVMGVASRPSKARCNDQSSQASSATSRSSGYSLVRVRSKSFP